MPRTFQHCRSDIGRILRINHRALTSTRELQLKTHTQHGVYPEPCPTAKWAAYRAARSPTRPVATRRNPENQNEIQKTAALHTLAKISADQEKLVIAPSAVPALLQTLSHIAWLLPGEPLRMSAAVHRFRH